MTDDLLPITQFVPSEVTPAPTALQVPTQRVRDKGAVKYAGFKIAVSAHRADVETWLAIEHRRFQYQCFDCA